MKQRQTLLTTTGANSDLTLRGTPDRERLILRCMIARDFYHMAAMYKRFFRQQKVTDAIGLTKLVEEELTSEDEPISLETSVRR